MATRVNKGFAAVRTVALAAAALAGLTVVTLASMPSRTRTSSQPLEQLQTVNARAYVGVLGLQPDALAAAGVNAQQAARVMSNLQAYMESTGNALDTAIDAWSRAERESDSARRAVQSDKGTLEELAAKQQTLSAALVSKQSAISAAFSAAVAQLNADTIETLERIKANRSQGVPAQYLVADRSSQQWRQLRDALSQKRVLERQGRADQLDDANAAVLSQADTDPAVFAAANHSANNLAAIKQAMGME